MLVSTKWVKKKIMLEQEDLVQPIQTYNKFLQKKKFNIFNRKF